MRHQFQLSKNASHVDIMTDINKPKKQYDTPPMSPSPRPFNWTGTKAQRTVAPEESYLESTEELYVKKKPTRPMSAHGAKKSNPFAPTKPPGPGQYYVAPTLLKPSFNRQFNGSCPDTKKDMQRHSRDAPIMPLMTNNRTGAFLNASKYRSMSAPPGGRTTESTASMSGSPNQKKKEFDSNAVSSKHPALLNVRYPPCSDKVIKRYSSVAAVSYQVPVPVPKKPCHETVLVPSPGKNQTQLFQ